MFSDLNFAGGAGSTVGAELELQVIDPQTGELAPGALRILNACEEERIEGVSGEFLLCMIEVKSGICKNVSQLRDDLVGKLQRVRNIAQSLGYELALGGTHPLARPFMSAVSPEARYQKILQQQGWTAYQEAVFGLHVHVGVPSGDAAIGVINNTVEYVPHLLALSANSPFWQGVDTGYVSARSRMFRPSATAGIPMHFKNWQEFCAYCAAMQEAGLIESTKDMYWDIRPQPQFGTVEYRVFDAPSTLAMLFGLVALTRCLVAYHWRAIADKPELAEGDAKSFWLASENRWLAARYGLETSCLRSGGGERRSIAADAAQLVATLLPMAEELGEKDFLKTVIPLAAWETGDRRQRRIFRETGDWKAVAHDQCSILRDELDRLSQPSAESNGRGASGHKVAAQWRGDAALKSTAGGRSSVGSLSS